MMHWIFKRTVILTALQYEMTYQKRSYLPRRAHRLELGGQDELAQECAVLRRAQRLAPFFQLRDPSFPVVHGIHGAL